MCEYLPNNLKRLITNTKVSKSSKHEDKIKRVQRMNREKLRPKVNKKKVSKSQTLESNTWDLVMMKYSIYIQINKVTSR